jgi:hypothetical protein
VLLDREADLLGDLVVDHPDHHLPEPLAVHLPVSSTPFVRIGGLSL